MKPWLPWIALVAACDGGEVAAPTFGEVDAEILGKGCAFSSCHGAGAGGLTLDGTAEDYDRLVGVASAAKPDATLVVAGDSDASYLVHKLEGRVGIVGEPMPQGSTLDPDLLDLLTAWIDAGALP